MEIAQYLSIRYSKRLAENGVLASVGSIEKSYDSIMVETIIGLFKDEMIHSCGPWRSLDGLKYAMLESVD